jgi:hypothetical protein
MASQRRDVAHWLREAINSGEARHNIDPDAEAESIVGAMAGIIFQALIDSGVSMHKLSVKLKSEIAERISALPPAHVVPQSNDRATSRPHG